MEHERRPEQKGRIELKIMIQWKRNEHEIGAKDHGYAFCPWYSIIN